MESHSQRYILHKRAQKKSRKIVDEFKQGDFEDIQQALECFFQTFSKNSPPATDQQILKKIFFVFF